MKFVNDKKVYSMFEVTKASSFSRQFLLELEESGLIKPYYKDKNTSYRYYDESIFVLLNEISLLLNAGLTKKEIKEFYLENDINNESILKKEKKEELIKLLKKKKDDIDQSLLFLSSSTNKTYRKQTEKIIYYYEERNVKDLSILPSLLKEIYIHALSKNYIFEKKNPFIIIPKESFINKDQIFDNNEMIKIKVCIPLIKDYKEKNIEEIDKSISLIYEINKVSFLDAYKNLKKILSDNKIKIKKDLIYEYFDNNESLKINRFILPL